MSRSTGQNVVAAAAYRTGERLTDHTAQPAQEEGPGVSVMAAAAYRTGMRLQDRTAQHTYDYSRRGGVITYFNLMPDHGPLWMRDTEHLWNEVERRETRKNSRLAREFELALPAAVSDEVRQDIATAFTQQLVDRYQVAATVAIHAPSGKESDLNYHAHILTTTRRVTATGLGEKTRELDDKERGSEEIKYLRAYAAYVINRALKEEAVDEHVDHRSFADRGIDRVPTVHVGVTAAAMERRGKPSIRGELNREVVERNDRMAQLVRDLRDIERDIADEQERLLDERYGEPTPELLTGEGALLPSKPEALPAALTPEEKAAAWEAQKRAATNAIADAEPFRRQMEETGELHDAIGQGRSWWGRTSDFVLHFQERAVDIARTGWQKLLDLMPGRGRSPESDDPGIEPDL